MTMAYVLLIHLMVVCPLIRLLSVSMKDERQASLIDAPGRCRRQRGVKVRRGGVKRTLKMWRTSFVLRHRRIVARWQQARASMKKRSR